jgi:hypothetical protein
MDKVAKKLDNINETLKGILHTLDRQENNFMKFLRVAGAVGGALAIFGVIDTIRKWIIGG